MSLIWKDRVQETATTTGTSDFTLAGAVDRYRTFAAVCSVSDTCYYAIEGAAGTGEWETGLGTYSGANTLARTSVIASSNANAAVNFSAGTKRVMLTATAAQFNYSNGGWETLTTAQADAGNSGTSETDIFTYTVAAGKLSADGDRLEAQYAGVFVSSGTATRQLKVKFAGTIVFDSGALTLSTSSGWDIFVTVIRVSSSVIRYAVSMTTQGAALSAYTATGELTGLTLGSTNILKLTGQAGGVGAATNDIVGKLESVSYYPVLPGALPTLVYFPGGTDVAVTDGGTGSSTPGGARTNLSAAALSQTAEGVCWFIASPSDKSYTLVLKAPHGGTITETTTKSASGTCTATFKINSTALGGTANSVSSAEQSQAHVSNNTFVAGDDIVLTVSSNSTCVDMSLTIKYTRVLE